MWLQAGSRVQPSTSGIRGSHERRLPETSWSFPTRQVGDACEGASSSIPVSRHRASLHGCCAGWDAQVPAVQASVAPHSWMQSSLFRNRILSPAMPCRLSTCGITSLHFLVQHCSLSCRHLCAQHALELRICGRGATLTFHCILLPVSQPTPACNSHTNLRPALNLLAASVLLHTARAAGGCV